MYFALRPTDIPNRSWARKTPLYISDKFKEAYSDSIFVDRDYLDDNLVSIYFLPNDYKNVSNEYRTIIQQVSQAFEVTCIWENILPSGYLEPIISFTITGFWEDVRTAHIILSYLINGYNALKVELTQEYRRIKINRRRRTQIKGLKTIKYPHAVKKAHKMWLTYIKEMNRELLSIEKHYSVLHTRKLLEIDKFILSTKKLNYKNYNARGTNKIHHAYCKKTSIILNRIII